MNEHAVLTVRKRWAMYWLTEAALIILCGGVCTLFPGSMMTAAVVLVILSAVWLWYYYRLEYSVSGGALKISSGIIFRKHRLIPPENVLWELRLTLPPLWNSAMVVLHTSGGRTVIFGEYSTSC